MSIEIEVHLQEECLCCSRGLMYDGMKGEYVNCTHCDGHGLALTALGREVLEMIRKELAKAMTDTPTPSQRAKVEQRHLELAEDTSYCDTYADSAQMLADFERDCRAEMKRAVLAEIDRIQKEYRSQDTHLNVSVDLLKRRIEAIP